MTVVEDPPSADEAALPEGLTEEECYLAAILMDRSGVDIAEFLFPDHTRPDGCFRLFPYQWEWWRAEHEQEVDQGARDIGKALDVATPVPTPTGWTTMGALHRGDKVYADDGSICSVIEAFDPMFNRPCFDVVFDDGATITADADHLWCTWSLRALRSHARGRRGHQQEIRTTAEIAASLKCGSEPNHRVDVAGALQGCDVDLPIPPYTLGAWLGDGSSYRAHMTIGPEDQDEMVSLLRGDGFVVEKLTGTMAWALKYPGIVNHKTGTVTAALRRLGVRTDKHIPMAYLRASREQRLALLQGLMDTDGHISKRWGRCEITQKNERLARGIFELVTSLGQRAFFEKKTARCNGVDAGPVFRVGFQPNEIMPFRLSRKVAQVRSSPAGTRLKHRRIVDVRPVPRSTVRCIVVDSSSRMFLVGEDMIPTHNSERICARAVSFPFSFPGQEHALVAPEGQHLDRLTNRIEGRIKSVRLLLEMVTRGANGITHRPFHIDWRSGAQTYALIPQRSGIGVKGVHAVWLDVDEAQDVPENAWKEMPMTVRKEVEGHRWVAHGVSKGVRTDTFFRITQPGSGWNVQRFTQLHKDTYDPKNRPQLVKDHGGSDQSGDFLRNVYGEHGDTQNRIFVLQHFNAAVDDRTEGSDVNDEYYQPTITGDEIAAMVGSKTAVDVSSEDATAAIQELLQFPISHRNKFRTFWAGMDVGLVGDPSEICVLAEYAPEKREREIHKRIEIAVPDEGLSRFRLVTRIRVLQLPEPLQADLIMWLIQYYEPKAFALDAGGNGLPVYQELMKRAGRSQIAMLTPPEMPDNATDEQRRGFAKEMVDFEERKHKARNALTVIKGYKFGSKILVDFNPDEVEKLGPNPALKDMVEKAGIHQEAKTRATDVLRTMVDNRRMLFPNDREFYDQMNGQTFVYSTEPIDAYGKRRAIFSSGTFHILDAMRFFALGQSQDRIEQIVAAGDKPKKPVIDRFVTY